MCTNHASGHGHAHDHDHHHHAELHGGGFGPGRMHFAAAPAGGDFGDGPPGPPPGFGGGPSRGRGFGPPWGGGGPRGGPRRRRRGETRGAILGLLAESPMHGYQVIQEIEARSEGMWRASPGSVYPTLQLLEDQGLIRGTEDEGRKVFTLTDEGTAEVERLGADARPWEQAAQADASPHMQLMRAVHQLAMAAHQVSHAAGSDQVTEAIAIVEDARRRLYGLLAAG